MKLTTLLFICTFVALPLPTTSWAQQTSNPLIAQLKSPNAKVRAKAARQLGKSGDTAAVPDLAAALTDPSSNVRSEVIVALATLHTLPSLKALLTATRDTNPSVRLLAVNALVGWYTGNIPSLGFVAQSYHSAANMFQSGPTAGVSPGTMVDPGAVAALEETMQDTRSIQAARRAAWGLGTLHAQAAVPDLVKAAHSVDTELATNALNALAKIKDITAGPQLVDLLDSSNRDVRQTAAVTVGILRTKSAVPKLESTYKTDSNIHDREAVLDGLAYIGDPSSYHTFIEALASADQNQRAYAAEGLARAGNSQALPALQEAMQVENKQNAKLAILFAQSALGKTQSLEELVDALPSRSYGDVAQSYLTELTRRKALLDAVYPYLTNSNAAIRRKLCYVLMYSGNASSIPQLQPLTHDHNGDVAAAALSAIKSIRSRTNSAA
jgi:HEAT repeat protein